MRGAVNGFFRNAVSLSRAVHSLAILFMLGFCSIAVSAADEKILAPDAVAFKADAKSGIGPTGITMTGK
jgi:hypothetical protein